MLMIEALTRKKLSKHLLVWRPDHEASDETFGIEVHVVDQVEQAAKYILSLK
jgi:hypothetical protein